MSGYTGSNRSGGGRGGHGGRGGRSGRNTRLDQTGSSMAEDLERRREEALARRDAEIARLQYDLDVMRATTESLRASGWIPPPEPPNTPHNPSPSALLPPPPPPPYLAHPFGFGETSPPAAVPPSQHQQQQQQQHNLAPPTFRPQRQPFQPTPPSSQLPQPPKEGMRNVVCGNCRQHGHELRTCMGPLVNGYLRGCPVHNITHHAFQRCDRFPRLSKSSILNFLVYSRKNRPPLEYGYDYRDLPDYPNEQPHPDQMRPWTVAFSLEHSEAWKTHVYQPKPRDEITIRDSAWDAPDIIPNQAAPWREHLGGGDRSQQRRREERVRERVRSRSPDPVRSVTSVRQRSPVRVLVEPIADRSTSATHREENIGAAAAAAELEPAIEPAARLEMEIDPATEDRGEDGEWDDAPGEEEIVQIDSLTD